MHRDLWLLPCGRLGGGDHDRWLRVGTDRACAHDEGFVEIRACNDGTQRSRRGADDGDTSARLGTQTEGHFGLGAA